MSMRLAALRWCTNARFAVQRLSCSHETRRLARGLMVNALAANIRLSPTEQELFDLLKQVLVTQNLPDTELRCAGGWVRDKLLGRQSIDIDIALNNLYGEEFAGHVNAYLQASAQKINKVAVIKSNPDQSKHLQTARMKVGELELDLVNLRSETYADSRIPEIGIGTPEQDALRRDLTINSLFYNINTGQVEDWTEHGLQDLRKGVIRTPLPPEQTFLDDPLRVLRAIRFGARFGFTLSSEVEEAAASPKVREVLGHKVSKERIGQELRLMLLGQDPARAVRDIGRLCLFPAVFQLPKSASAPVAEGHDSPCLQCFESFTLLLQQRAQVQLDPAETCTALAAALLLPLRGITVKERKSREPAPAWLVRDGIKWNNRDADGVAALHACAPQLAQVHQQLQAPELASTPAEAGEGVRIALGHALRQLGELGLWRSGIMLASLLRLPAAQALGVETEQASGSSTSGVEGPDDVMQQQVEFCESLEAAVGAFKLEGCWTWKHLLNGKQVMEELGAKGPSVGRARAKMLDWQLANPTAGEAEALQWLRQEGKRLLD